MLMILNQIKSSVDIFFLDMWKKFADGSLLFQHNITPLQVKQPHEKGFSQFNVEECGSPAQSRDLNLLQRLRTTTWTPTVS